jgi:hypothetical protein
MYETCEMVLRIIDVPIPPGLPLGLGIRLVFGVSHEDQETVTGEIDYFVKSRHTTS